MFASKSLGQHLLRGAIGIGALVTTALWSSSHPWRAIAALPVALLALRGCPMCWMVGLLQTVFALRSARFAGQTCVDGSCALPLAQPAVKRTTKTARLPDSLARET